MKGELKGAGFAIEMHERYRDVARDRWPVSIEPLPEEVFSSWIHRLALANGIAPRAFSIETGHRGGMWSPRLEGELSAYVAALLGRQTGVSPEMILATAFNNEKLGPLLLPLRVNAHRSLSTWMQYCPLCLREDAIPYFRRQWRLASRVSCFIHRRGLRDRCPKCRSGIASFDQGELVPQHFCARCGFDLRAAAGPVVRSSARRLDHAVADMLRVEAVKGAPAAGDLIDRVLRIPNVAKIPPAKTLVNFSASARIACYERLALRSPDWLIPDNDPNVAYRRCMILTAGGHKNWIDRFADFLEEDKGPPPRKRSYSEKTNPAALFEAYLRIMTTGRKKR